MVIEAAMHLGELMSYSLMPVVALVSVHAFDDAHVPLARVAERGECLLIGGAVMGGDGLFNAIELNRYGALCNSLLIGFDGTVSSKEAARHWRSLLGQRAWRRLPVRRGRKSSGRK